MQKEFSRKDIKEKQVIIIYFFRFFKQIVKRTEGSQLKIPKVHELLHSSRDIFRHGPARGYDTCPTESNHRPLKNFAEIHTRNPIRTAGVPYKYTDTLTRNGSHIPILPYSSKLQYSTGTDITIQ